MSFPPAPWASDKPKKHPRLTLCVLRVRVIHGKLSDSIYPGDVGVMVVDEIGKPVDDVVYYVNEKDLVSFSDIKKQLKGT